MDEFSCPAEMRRHTECCCLPSADIISLGRMEELGEEKEEPGGANDCGVENCFMESPLLVANYPKRLLYMALSAFNRP